MNRPTPNDVNNIKIYIYIGSFKTNHECSVGLLKTGIVRGAVFSLTVMRLMSF